IETLQEHLCPGARLDVRLTAGEICVVDGEDIVLDGVFVSPEEEQRVLLWWSCFLRTNTIPDEPDAKGLAAALRRIRTTNNATLTKQILDLDVELAAIEKDISATESNLNALVNSLYSLNKN